jgi:hypothetical protein
MNFIEFPNYCISWIWLWNLGYFLSIVALITKPIIVTELRLDHTATEYVNILLRRTVRQERQANNITTQNIVASQPTQPDPSDSQPVVPKIPIEFPPPVSAANQVSSIIAQLILILAGLIAWTIISPPTYAETVSGGCVVTNACSSPSPNFQIANYVLRLVAAVGAVLTALSLRNTKRFVTEFKSISFVVYNWLIFEVLQVAIYSILSNSPASQVKEASFGA